MTSFEKDPEKLWKNNKGHWNEIDNDIEGHEGTEVDQHSFSFFQHVKVQLIISIIVFLALLGANQFQHPSVQQVKGWMQAELQRSLDFVAIASWYEGVFQGSPSFIPLFGNKSELALGGQVNEHEVSTMPIKDGVVLHTFAELLNGIEIAGEPGAEVYAVEKGRVILVPPQQDSVIIQHANDRISIYTRLSSVGVAVNDWVEVGTSIGKLATLENEEYGVLFLAMKQNDLYIDPLDVISLE